MSRHPPQKRPLWGEGVVTLQGFALIHQRQAMKCSILLFVHLEGKTQLLMHFLSGSGGGREGREAARIVCDLLLDGPHLAVVGASSAACVWLGSTGYNKQVFSPEHPRSVGFCFQRCRPGSNQTVSLTLPGPCHLRTSMLFLPKDQNVLVPLAWWTEVSSHCLPGVLG